MDHRSAFRSSVAPRTTIGVRPGDQKRQSESNEVTKLAKSWTTSSGRDERINRFKSTWHELFAFTEEFPFSSSPPSSILFVCFLASLVICRQLFRVPAETKKQTLAKAVFSVSASRDRERIRGSGKIALMSCKLQGYQRKAKANEKEKKRNASSNAGDRPRVVGTKSFPLPFRGRNSTLLCSAHLV
jgi:hypothetical protein